VVEGVIRPRMTPEEQESEREESREQKLQRSPRREKKSLMEEVTGREPLVMKEEREEVSEKVRGLLDR
jgi:hypothetical protein